MDLPPSSPRLPSPPPPTEIQIGPKSPSIGSFPNQEPTIEQSIIEANANRRIHPGTRAADMAAGPPLISLSELDSAFQLQEHLKALHYHYSKPQNSDSTTPITRETAIQIAIQPDGVDHNLWLYELCRFLINKCNDLIIGFLFDDPPCSASTCPEMRASEWQFLCAVHEQPKSCCAIDYCCHTLDWATNIVTSQKIFPSRLSLGAGDAVDERGAGVKHLTNIFRRLHRIFAHAWFQHRGVFWQVEGQTGLYVLFKTVCDTYNLLPPENYKLPPEAEGLEPAEETRAVPSVLKPDPPPINLLSAEDDLTNAQRTNTRRHIRQSPSVGSAVTTVLEADEEDSDITRKLGDLHVTDEEGEAEVPVIVESYEPDVHHGVAAIEHSEPQRQSEPILEQASEAEHHAPEDLTPVVQDESSNSIISSWDRVSSESESTYERAAVTELEKSPLKEQPEQEDKEVLSPSDGEVKEEKPAEKVTEEKVTEEKSPADIGEEPKEKSSQELVKDEEKSVEL